MLGIKTLGTIVLAALMLACNNSGVNDAANDSIVNDTSPRLDTIKKPASLLADSITGYYTGILPCNDCEGIRQMILFSPDMTFHLEENFIGKNVAPYLADGRWEILNDTALQILVKDSIIGQYAVSNSGLIHLGQSGVPLTPEIAARYLLKKQNIGSNNAAWMNKKQKGIDFIVVGNEPFWALDIDDGKHITFLLAETNKPVQFPFSEPSSESGRSVYNTKQGSSTLKFSITKKFCSDGMSDTWYEYAVELDYNGNLYRGCGVNLQ